MCLDWTEKWNSSITILFRSFLSENIWIMYLCTFTPLLPAHNPGLKLCTDTALLDFPNCIGQNGSNCDNKRESHLSLLVDVYHNEYDKINLVWCFFQLCSFLPHGMSLIRLSHLKLATSAVTINACTVHASGTDHVFSAYQYSSC